MTEQVRSPSTDPRKVDLPHVPSSIQGDQSPQQRPAYFRIDQNTRTEQQADVDYPTVAVMIPTGWDDSTPEPLPMYLVAAPPRDLEIKRSSVNRLQVQASKHSNLADNSDHRTRLIVTNNDDTDSVFLTRDASTPVAFGYELAPGITLELLHNDAVWARCATGESAYVSTISEYLLSEVDTDE